MLNFIEPTSSRKIEASSPVKASWRSSRIVAATKREVSALDLRVLKTSWAVTASEWGLHES